MYVLHVHKVRGDCHIGLPQLLGKSLAPRKRSGRSGDLNLQQTGAIAKSTNMLSSSGIPTWAYFDLSFCATNLIQQWAPELTVAMSFTFEWRFRSVEIMTSPSLCYR